MYLFLCPYIHFNIYVPIFGYTYICIYHPTFTEKIWPQCAGDITAEEELSLEQKLSSGPVMMIYARV